jgi:type IV pilus assembly protein PilM
VVDWKKEITFGGGGKKKQDDTSAEQTPIWKKEIKLGGGKKEPKQPKQPKQAKQAKQAKEPKPEQQAKPKSETSVWKKEISFGRKPKDATPSPEPELVERALELEDQPAAVELVRAYAPEPVPVAEPVVEQPTQIYAAPDPEPEAEPVIELVALDPEPEPVATPEFVLVTDAELEPVAELPVEPEIVDLTAPEPSPAPAPIAAVPAAPSLPAAEPVVVHPPVPAAQLPPVADEQMAESEANVPFYKRDFSLGRKEKAPKEPKEKKQKQQKAENPEKQKREKTPKGEKPKRERRSISVPRPAPRASRGGGKLPKRLVGLKIGASQLAAATVSNNGHSEVMQIARQDLDPGIVSAGELREPDLLAEALKEFFRKNKLPKRGVRLGIATNRIGVRTLEIVGITDQKQLANAIKFRAQEALPIPIDEAVLDYHQLSEGTNDEGESVRKILLVLAYRDLIDRYVSACKKAGIQLVGIDLEAFALLRALAAPREETVAAQAALVAVTVGYDRTTFAVSDGRVCEFTRVLDWGGHSLNVGLARALDRAPSEVEEIKRGLSLDGLEVPEGLTPQQAETAREALRRQVQSFARELVSSLQFYQNQPGSLGIGEIVLTGGTAHLQGLAEELEKLIGVRVRVGDPLVRVKISKKLRDPEQLGSLAVAIGLGIED